MTDRTTRRARPFAAIAAALREKYGRPARGAPVEQHRSERPRPRVSYADAKAAADRNYAAVKAVVAVHREHVRVHGLEPLDDAVTAADMIAAEIIEAAGIRDRGGHDLPKLTGEAAAIIRAGKVRRGEL